MKCHALVLLGLSCCLGCPSKSPDAATATDAANSTPTQASQEQEKTYPARQLDRARAETEAATKALEARNANIDRASSTP